MTTADTPGLPAPGRMPVATPRARHIGVVLALLLLASGTLALREAAVMWGWLAGTSWITPTLAALDGLHSQWWMVLVGAVVLGAGVCLVFLALRPRRKTAVAVDARAAVWIRPRDVALLASHAAASVPGVEVLHSEATRRKVVLHVGLSGTQPDAVVKTTITDAVGSAIEILVAPPQIAIRISSRESP